MYRCGVARARRSSIEATSGAARNPPLAGLLGDARVRQRHPWLWLAAAMCLATPFADADAEEDRAQPHVGHVLEEVVVIGVRRGDRTNVDTPAPVYVIGEPALRDQGNTDLLDAPRTVVPSFSVNARPIADGATIARPPNLRNLVADHTLVLVNGKRRHRGAVIAWLVPTASEGAQGPDLSVIPAIRPRARRGPARRSGRAVRLRCHRRRHQLRAEGRPGRRQRGTACRSDRRGRRRPAVRRGQRGVPPRRRIREPERRVRRRRRHQPQRSARRRGGIDRGRQRRCRPLPRSGAVPSSRTT